MTSKLKCPVCQQELGIILCDLDDFVCSKCRMCGSEKLWTALIQAKQDLEIARNALKNMSLGNVPSLPDDETLANAMCNYARDTLKQIEHKE